MFKNINYSFRPNAVRHLLGAAIALVILYSASASIIKWDMHPNFAAVLGIPNTNWLGEAEIQSPCRSFLIPIWRFRLSKEEFLKLDKLLEESQFTNWRVQDLEIGCYKQFNTSTSTVYVSQAGANSSRTRFLIWNPLLGTLDAIIWNH